MDEVETLPVAGPRPDVEGCYRTAPEDFLVDELPAAAFDGCGEHLCLQIEKRGQNTRWVADRLAAHFGVAPVEVGYAGRKDRHAVTRQWFSVRLPQPAGGEQGQPSGDGYHVLATVRHRRKLRPGDHGGNRFRVRLRHLHGEIGALRKRLQAAVTDGLVVPNYFGPQRFGRDGANIARARRWLVAGAQRGVRRSDRGMLLSAARALVFNQVLAARVADGTWRTPVDGDVIVAQFPSGPLWGRGRRATTGRAAACEDAALARVTEWLNPLEHCGLRQERRALAVAAAEFTVSWQAADPWLSFTLPPGSFATSVLRELFKERTGGARKSEDK